MRGLRRFIGVVLVTLGAAAFLAGSAAPNRPFVDPLKNWEGVHDTQHSPAHAAAAVGTGEYLELTDAKYGIYTRSGGTLASGDLSDFVPSPPAGHGGVYTQPQVLWDPPTGRFYFAFLDLNPAPFPGDGTNYVVYGFSTGETPQSAADFCTYVVDFGGYKHLSGLPDGDAFYPDRLRMGDTRHFVLFGVDVFDWANGSYFGSDIDWVEKPTAPGCPPTNEIDASTDSKTGIQDTTGHAMRSPVPAVLVDSQFTDKTGVHDLPGWIVASRPPASGTASQLSLLKVTEAGTQADPIPSLTTAPVSVPVAGYTAPDPAAQPGGSLDTGDGELTNAVAAIDPAHGAAAQALWTQHTVGGAGGRSQVRWYELNPTAKGVFQSGTAGSGTLAVFNGAIAPDRLVTATATKFGSDMALGVTSSSSTDAPAFQWLSKEGTGAQTALSPLVQSPDPASGRGCEDPGDGPVCAWAGAAASSDPAADQTMAAGGVWMTNAWASGTGDASTANWRTQNAAVRIPLSPPAITSISPTSGPIGTKVTVNGSRFLGITAVQIGDKALTQQTITATKITGNVPADATTNTITVTNEGGAASTQLFKVTPTIATFAPSGARIGDTVTVTGTNLDEAVAFKLGTLQVSNYHADTSTHATFDVPPNAVTGKLSITITTAAGPATFTTSSSFQVRPTTGSPLVPDHGPAGTVVTIPGSSFAGVNSVKFSGFAGTPSVTAAFSFKNGVLTATVPKGAASGPVSVTTSSGGTTVSDTGFAVTPSFGSLSPANGPVGGTVTINGAGFDSATTATFGGGVPADPPLAGSTPNALKVAVPLNAVTGAIQVQTSAGSLTTSSFGVTPSITTNPLPTVHAGDLGVDLQGYNLDEVTGAKIGSVALAASAVHPVSPNDLQLDVPANALTGTITITSTSPPGSFTTSGTLEVAPHVAAVAPSPFQGAAGTTVTITGTAISGVTAIRFTGPGGPNTVTGSKATIAGGVKTTVPTGAVSGPITVTTAGGSDTTPSFTVLPRIASFSPTSGVAGSTVVTINGSGFQSTASVKFGPAQAAAPSSVTATQIKVNVAPGAGPGQVPITVTNPDSPGVVSTGKFTVTAAITQVSASTGLPGGSVTITGFGFSSSAQVFFGGTATALGTVGPASVTARTGSTQITVSVPNSATTGRIAVRNGTSSASPFVTSPADYAISAGLPSPTHGNTGDPVTLLAPGIQDGATVTMNNKPVADLHITHSPDQATFTVPNGSGGNADVPIVVTNPGDASSASSSQPFHIDLGIDDAGSVLTGHVGQSFLIRGGKFQGSVTVKIGNVTVPDAAISNAASITGHIPDDVTAATVTVTTDDGTVQSGQNFVPQGGAVTGSTPQTGPTGTQVTLSGLWLRGADTVTYNGQTVPIDSVDGPDIAHLSLHITIPDGAVPANQAHSANIVVTDPVDPTHPSSSQFFEVTNGISSFTPASGAATADVTISGVGFTSGSTVTFAGASPVSATLSISTGDLTAKVPADAQDGKITVTTDGTSVKSASAFDVTVAGRRFEARQLH